MDSSQMLAKLRICVMLIRNHLKVTTEGTEDHIILFDE